MPMTLRVPGLPETLESLKAGLLAARTPHGPWVGELSSSALSTAVASFGLHAADAHGPLVLRGLQWLADHQNPDGGWGDTVDSPTNLSTTLLCTCALGLPEGESMHGPSLTRARDWIGRAAGGLDPRSLAEAVDRFYGKDKTFSVPILTVCALSGLLGPGEQAWRLVRPLPFELAVLPGSLYRSLRLPVVSYALPALIVMGQAHFSHRRPRCPLTRAIRSLSRGRSLSVLASLQPENGGFLEASPLTGFVLMSLASSGQARHPVAIRAIDFLAGGIRDDGSWPIDTNLATWVTTLAVNALTAGGQDLPEPAAGELLRWLLACQCTRVHPYTRAAPGGWPWSDLTGAVPDADDTAGALLALRHLGPGRSDVQAAAIAGIRWLMGLQNRDGGIPTFCRGWMELPFDKSTPDITAHAVHAMIAWLQDVPAALSRQVRRSIDAAIAYLVRVQQPEGSWIPLWFGSQHSPDHTNPIYGTSRVLTHLARIQPSLKKDGHSGHPDLASSLARASRWLWSSQGPDGGWGGLPGVQPTLEETAVAVDALAECLLAGRRTDPAVSPDCSASALRAAATRGAVWLTRHVDPGQPLPASPIGLYFAHLWYHERLYPIVFTVAALNKISLVQNAS
jgi:squalene-hopene/tetraprenyl-beta-curcumene cyclase